MKRFFKSLTAIMLSVVLMLPYTSIAAVPDNSREIHLNDTAEFNYTYNEETDNGKIAATYSFTPDSTDYYDISLDEFISEDTFLGVYDSDGKELLFKGFGNPDDSKKPILKLTAGKTYYFVVFYCKAEENGNNDFSVQASVSKMKFSGQPEDIKCTSSIGSKLGFSRSYKTALLKNATKVDIYVNYNSEIGGTYFNLFIGSSCTNKAKTKKVKVTSAGWYSLDISDLSLDKISKDGMFFVGFESTDKTTSGQLLGCSASCTSDYFADAKIYSTTSSGNWFNQEAKAYVGFCALFYYDKMDFKLTRHTAEVEESKPFRAVFISDIHYCNDDAGAPLEVDTYDLARGTRGDERMQAMVDAINAEHHKNPIDFVMFAGDLRSITTSNRNTKLEDLEKLRDRWLSQLEMPYYAIRGNHDGYSNEDWRRIIGNDTQFTIETEDYAFICVDVYDYEKAPFFDSEGNHIPTFKYAGADLYYSGFAPQMDWVKSEVAKEKEKGKKIWIVSHHLAHTTPESAGASEKVDETEFLNLFQNEESIIGIIKGHAHIPGLNKTLTVADKAVNDGAGYVIPKFNINTGNFGAIPLNSKNVTPDSYRCGFKVLEMQEDGLKAYHIYPALTYPRWKTSSVDGEFDNKSFDYYKGSMTKVDAPKVKDTANDISLKSTITLTKHIHDFDITVTEASCTKEGSTVKHCKVCGAKETEIISKKPHTIDAKSTTVTKATVSKDGKTVSKCAVCGTAITTAIAYPKTITLSASSYVYDGKVKAPKVTVKDSKGKAIAASNYTVSYASGRKNVGKYAVKITFKGNYSGTKTLYFTIVPKGTTISSVAAASKGFTVKWKKQATQTTGYQIQYSTDANFKKGNKTVNIGSSKTVSKKITKLTGKKKYYVRVRTYKKVGSTTYYSAWSAKKNVVTKK